jgi:hypothetical protein
MGAALDTAEGLDVLIVPGTTHGSWPSYHDERRAADSCVCGGACRSCVRPRV